MSHKKIKINYFYYGFIFLFIAFSTVSNVLALETIKTGYFCYFIFHCLAQSLLEVSFFVIIGYVIERYLGNLCFLFFLSFTFIFFLTHVIDFILIRFMELPFFEALGMILDEKFWNFIELLRLSGVPAIIWIIFGCLILFLPFIGIGTYKLLNKLSEKKPLLIRREMLFACSFCLIATLFLWDFSTASAIRGDIFQTYQKSLPWKTTFLKNKTNYLTIKNSLKSPPSEKLIKKEIANTPLLKKKPNIYLFVIESLREDFITKEIAPALFSFKEENAHLLLTFANSNNTTSSWYSIFNSYYPFYLPAQKKHNWKSGSIPLSILKKAGYKIHVFSSSGLYFYNMDELLFGKKRHLLTSCFEPKGLPFETDRALFEKALENKSLSGNIFIFFFESTHFNYSWPPSFPQKFSPILSNMHNFATYDAKDIYKIKNRYRNAIHYMDSLFGNFFTELKKRNLYDKSIIVVTADHGEEFYEKGHLFHASDLSDVQTRVPIYYRFNNKKREFSQKNEITSQVDIFPTILDYLFQKKYPYFHGQSLFHETYPYIISTRFNASRSPNEFFLHDGKNKITLRFSKSDIFNTKKLQILTIRDLSDEIYLENYFKKKDVLEDTKKALDVLFSK